MSADELRRPTTYAIDYDGTWTTDSEEFRAIATMLRRRGHKVIIVTSRVRYGHAVHEVEGECRPYVDAIVFAGRGWKRQEAERAGYKVDVWIDDMPEMIGRPSAIVGW